MEVFSDTILPQQTRKITSSLILYLKQLNKEEQIKPKVDSVQFSHSVNVQLFVTPWAAARQASLSITNSWSILKLMSIDDFPGGSDGKASVYNAGDLGSIPRSGRSPGEGNGNPL